MKIFLDTNVLASAIATRGLCADVMRLVLAEHEMVLSRVVLDELRGVLTTKFGLPPTAVEDIFLLFDQLELAPQPQAPVALAIDDPADEWVVASAVAGQAAIFVTGDKALLEIGHGGGLRLLSPRQFWEQLSNFQAP